MSVFTSFSEWWLILVPLAGLLAAWALYFFPKKSPFSKTQKYILAGFRFLWTALIVLLLLNPMLKTEQRQLENPSVVFAFDNSKSMVAGADSSDFKLQLDSWLKKASEQLADKATVNLVGFDANVRTSSNPDFSGEATDFFSLFKSAEDRYLNRNLAAMVVISDGIVNKGSDPALQAERLNVPIFTINTGNPNPNRDIRISGVRYNEVAYLNKIIAFEVEVEADLLNGLNSSIKFVDISGGQNKILETKAIEVNSNGFRTKYTFLTEAKAIGKRRFQLVIDPVDGEQNLKNNVRTVSIDVVEKQNKVLVLYHSPHPDITALRQSLTQVDGNEVEAFQAEDFVKDLSSYQTVVLHQIPAIGKDYSALLKKISVSGVSTLFITGTQSSFGQMRSIQNVSGLNVMQANSSNLVLPELNNNFSLFTLSNELKTTLATFPPVESAFGDYTTAGNAQILLSQRIGSVSSNYPLLVFGEENGRRIAVFNGLGIWKWRLEEFKTKQQALAFQELWAKTIQYLGNKEQRKRFVVDLLKSKFDAGEQITFTANLYNPSFELITDPEVKMSIKNEEGKVFPFVFGKSANNYQLNAGSFPEGAYTWVATTKTNDGSFTASGSFSVEYLNLEANNLTANHQLLESLSAKTSGSSFLPKDFDACLAAIEALPFLKPVSYLEQKLSDLISIKWLLLLVIIIAAIEWFLRKYLGSY